MAAYWENSCSFGLRYVSWYKYLIVGLVFSHLGFWSGNLFLIAPFPDLCLLVPFYNFRSTNNFCILQGQVIVMVIIFQALKYDIGSNTVCYFGFLKKLSAICKS